MAAIFVLVVTWVDMILVPEHFTFHFYLGYKLISYQSTMSCENSEQITSFHESFLKCYMESYYKCLY